jgi:vacuolar-type H+-ATPase subunit H
MDILHLVDRLEQALNESRQLPLTASLLVDQDRIFNIVDQMRVAIPEAIKRANRIEAEKERILAQAKEEANRIRELARQEAMELVSRDALVANSQKRADQILQHAHHEAERTRVGADQYAERVLAQLETDMTRALSIVRNGLSRLEMDLQIAESLLQSADPEPDSDPAPKINLLSNPPAPADNPVEISGVISRSTP